MAHDKKTVLAKIEYLRNELSSLENYYYVPDTYQYVVKRLDEQEILLKQIEVEEAFAAIEAEAEEDPS